MNVIEGFKEVVSLVQKIDNIELLQKILELQGQALQSQSDLIEKDKLLQEKEQEILKLKKYIEYKKKLILLSGFYFDVDKNGNPIGDPFCPHCFEVNKILVHVHMALRGTPGAGSFCPSCKNQYKNYFKITPENQKEYIK